jgi:putative membrane protein
MPRGSMPVEVPRSSRYSRYSGLALVTAACVVLGGCKAKENATTTSSGAVGAPPSDSTAAATATTPSSAPTSAALSDANIVALLDEVNMADSALAAAALPKATRSDVKSFAKLMMGEHHALRLEGQRLARAQQITPQPPADDPFTAAVQDEQAAQAAAAKGHAFDSTYIAKEIGVHQAVIGWAGTAMSQAQNQALKDLIQAAGLVYQKHVDRAQAIMKQLGGSTA